MNKVAQVIKIYKLLQPRPHRLSVRKAQEVTGLPKRAVYRRVQEMAMELPVRLEAGVIVLDIDALNNLENAMEPS